MSTGLLIIKRIFDFNITEFKFPEKYILYYVIIVEPMYNN